jgi:hypothetical protein
MPGMNTAARLDTLERETLPHFRLGGLGRDASGRVLVVGSTGDSTFVDAFAGSQFLGRETLDCFTPTRYAVNNGWIALQCRDRDEENRTYTIQLYRAN